MSRYNVGQHIWDKTHKERCLIVKIGKWKNRICYTIRRRTSLGGTTRDVFGIEIQKYKIS